MSAFWSRVVVALAGLPAVLGLVYLGGWWLFILAAVAAALALHEFWLMARPLRPLALGGYAGVAATLVGAQLGGIDWMTAGFLATFAVAFVLQGISDTRAPATVALGSTVLAAAWIGLGLAHIVLLRQLSEHAQLAVFTLLLAVWADDTVAYFVGRLVGRHKLAPVISPGKTWEGFLAGSLAAIFVAFVANYKYHLVDGWRSVVLGVVIALAAAAGDLFESALKRDMRVKDTGRTLAGHGGMLDRIDSLLFAAPAAYYAILALR